MAGSVAAVAANFLSSDLLWAVDGSNRTRLAEFDYADVRLTGGPLKEQYDRVLASFLALNDDRLLKVYRQRAHLPAPGDDMGDWYDAEGFVPGHTLGQYISGLSRYARSTGERRAVAKARALVNGFAKTLGPDGFPYASAKAATTWPCYILDKYEIGLLDAYRLAGISEARTLLPRVIQGALPHIPDHTYDRGPNSPKQAPYDETYILSENLFNTWEVTGDRTYFEMAKKYLLNAEYYEPLAAGRNILPGKHAYSHVISLSSAAKAYQLLGEPMYLAAIRNAWDMIETTQQFASGGWGPNETFVEPNQGKLYESLASTEDHFEAPCGCYAHMKLARYLLGFTGEARYGDGLERVLYNSMLAALDPDGDGRYFYYVSHKPLVQKCYYKMKWPCCSGTLVQGVADYVLNLYFHGPDALYVNVFAPSEVDWKVRKQPVRIVQNTNYPHDGSVELRVETAAPLDFTLQLRIPRWISGSPTVTINGKTTSIPAEPGTFAAIRRRWSNHDRVELTLPFGFRTEAIDNQHPDTVAVMRGPLMYVAVAPPSNIASLPLDLPRGLASVAHSPKTFAYDLPTQSLSFRPYYELQNEQYNSYFQLKRG
jgi:DUF1680 family protein